MANVDRPVPRRGERRLAAVRAGMIAAARAGSVLALSAAAVVLAVAGTGALGRAELPTGTFVLQGGSTTLLTVLSVLVVPFVVLAMLLHRLRSQNSGEEASPWLQRAIVVVLAVLAVLVLRDLYDREPVDDTSPTGPGPAGPVDVLGWTVPAASVAITLLLVAAAALAWRWQRRRLRDGRGSAAGVEVDLVQAAVRAGRAALSADAGDPRTAVVRCYAAMEDALAAAGAPRRAADAPEELLRRAVGDGAVPAAPAGVLTRLFVRARFSAMPVSEQDVVAARAALAEVDGVLEGAGR